MTLARRHIFVDGDIIRADEISNEFDQIYQFLTGVQAGKLLLKNTGPNTVLLVNNAASIPLPIALQLSKGNEPKVNFYTTGKIESFVDAVAPFDVASTTKVSSLWVELLDDLPLTSFLLSGKKVDQFITFYFEGIPVVGDKLTWICPAGTTMLINQFFCSSDLQTGIYPSDDSDVTITLAKNGATIVAPFLISPLWSFNNTVPFSSNLVENDLITVTITGINGTDKPRNIQCRVNFRQTLIS